jgi:carbonic anhydrase
MTAAEAHQQQLEQQQWYEDLENIRSDFNKNHGKFLGVARFIRDNARGERDVQDAIKYLMQVLEEHDQIQRRLP